MTFGGIEGTVAVAPDQSRIAQEQRLKSRIFTVFAVAAIVRHPRGNSERPRGHDVPAIVDESADVRERPDGGGHLKSESLAKNRPGRTSKRVVIDPRGARYTEAQRTAGRQVLLVIDNLIAGCEGERCRAKLVVEADVGESSLKLHPLYLAEGVGQHTVHVTVGLALQQLL